MKQLGCFDAEERLAHLDGLDDQLKAFSRTVDFEVFRPDLDQDLAYSDGSKCGRSHFDAVLMLKNLVIQRLNNLSDERTEYLINDHLSFMRVLGLGLSGPCTRCQNGLSLSLASDAGGAINGLFNRFDATLVAFPKQRNSNAEKTDFRTGQILQD